MSENEKLTQEATPVTDEELKDVNGGSTHNYNGLEFERVYSFTSCFTRFGEKGDTQFKKAPEPSLFSTPIYKSWWTCSTSEHCGCCRYLYIDGASDGICWHEYYGTLPPDHEKRGF